MKDKKLKSVISSQTGEALRTISVITLIFGIIASIILLVQSFQEVYNGYRHESVFNWITFANCLQVLFGSIFICIVGRAIAKAADYIEAIYKNVNPDYKMDRIFEMGTTFLPGDVVMAKEGEVQEQVSVIDVIKDASGYYRYRCQKTNGEVVEKYLSEIKANENK